MSQKNGDLEGGGDEDILASSESIHDKSAFGMSTKGLQQFFTQPAAAKLVADVLYRTNAVIDLTAGNGMLLREWEPTHSFGVEIDRDQIKASEGSYNAIKGDIQHVFPLLQQLAPEWPAVACNPPFGLKWTDPTINNGRPTNSTVATFIYANRLLSEQGQLAFLCGKARWERQLRDLPEAEGIYAMIDVEGLFDNVMLDCCILFGIHPGNRSAESVGFTERKATNDTLDLMGPWVSELRQKALGHYNYLTERTRNTHTTTDNFKAIQSEYDRRLEKRLGKGARHEFDVALENAKIKYSPSAYAQMALRRQSDDYTFSGLNGQPVNYFALNERLWLRLMDYSDSKILRVDPRLKQLVEELLLEAKKTICPLYPIKVTQRLGFLTDITSLRCTKSDPAKNFIAGESYPLKTDSQTIETTETRPVESKKNPGEWENKTFLKYQKVLKVRVGKWAFNDGDHEASDNIAYLINHFHIPDPGDVTRLHGPEITKLEHLCDGILDEFTIRSAEWEKTNNAAIPFKKRQFQKKDIARLVFKQSGLLSWEQGLGKTVGGLLFASACVRLGAQNARLIITAKDLIPQWQREIKRFYGTEAILINTHGKAKEVANHLRKGGTGLYITYYEALSQVGMSKSKKLPTVTVKEWEEERVVKGTDRYGYYYFDATSLTPAEKETLDTYYGTYDSVNEEGDPVHGLRLPQIPVATKEECPEGCEFRHGYIRAKFEKVTKKKTSNDLCPECHADYRNGWNGTLCSNELPTGAICGYAHYEVRMKPIASLLSGAFAKGVIVMDEGTLIQGDTAARSIAIRGMRAKHKLLMTGTPIKNFIGQAFWLLWWCLGDSSKRFPYAYAGGYTEFENNFSVIEYVKNGNRKDGRKALPEVTNLSMLWRLLCSSIIRRRKEETGEKLVKKYFHDIHVPLGITQTEQMQKWMKDFATFFIEHPVHKHSKLAKAGKDVVQQWAPMIGLNWKLDFACTVPTVDPDAEWTGIENLSNFTPANQKVVELSMALAKEGRKVLIGSNLKRAPKWIVEQLNEKGVKAVHILDAQDNTANPDKRAKQVYAFQTQDDVQVFAAGVNAVRLGHNLDAADAVILHGLDWSFDTLDQFINRVHRLTSKNDIDIFIILPTLEGQETITTRKWQLLANKKGAAELALDGRLIEQIEAHVDTNSVIADLVARGITVTDDAVDESDVEEAWAAIPSLDEFEIPAGLIPPRPEVEEDFEWTEEDAAAALALYEQMFPPQEMLALHDGGRRSGGARPHPGLHGRGPERGRD
jgi:SNF2 family DNA or RNA helicase